MYDTPETFFSRNISSHVCSTNKMGGLQGEGTRRVMHSWRNVKTQDSDAGVQITDRARMARLDFIHG